MTETRKTPAQRRSTASRIPLKPGLETNLDPLLELDWDSGLVETVCASVTGRTGLHGTTVPSVTLMLMMSEVCRSLDSHQYGPVSIVWRAVITHEDPFPVPQTSPQRLLVSLLVFLLRVQSLSSHRRDRDSPLKNWDQSGLTLTEAVTVEQISSELRRSREDIVLQRQTKLEPEQKLRRVVVRW